VGRGRRTAESNANRLESIEALEALLQEAQHDAHEAEGEKKTREQRMAHQHRMLDEIGKNKRGLLLTVRTSPLPSSHGRQKTVLE
jgi:hypothetical protein